MNLREWIRHDHASVRTRFEQSIVAQVPRARWTDTDHGNSIAWLVLHATYHQDLALNTAVRNRPPLLDEHRHRLGLGGHDATAGLSEAEDPAVTLALDLDELDAYRVAVHDSTSAWIGETSSMALDTTPPAGHRLERRVGITATGPLSWLHAMWTGKPVAWFVQWECIGHGHTHNGEMTALRNRMGLSPF